MKEIILWTLGFGLFIYLVTRVLFGWYNLSRYILHKHMKKMKQKAYYHKTHGVRK